MSAKTKQELIADLYEQRDKVDTMLDQAENSVSVDGTTVVRHSAYELRTRRNTITQKINRLRGQQPVTKIY